METTLTNNEKKYMKMAKTDAFSISKVVLSITLTFQYHGIKSNKMIIFMNFILT